MREKIEKRRKTIRNRIGEKGYTDGAEIATQEEIKWLVEQAARDGILLSVSASPGTWQKDNECYYYYWAIGPNADKERIKQFVDTRSLLSDSDLRKLLNYADNQQIADNIKQLRRLIQSRDRRRRRRQREREQAELEERIADYYAAKESSIQNWEYKVVSNPFKCAMPERMLNEEGEQGWELISVVIPANQYIFKRPKF